MTKHINIKTISNFLAIYLDNNLNFDFKNDKKFDLSKYFWNIILNKDFLEHFLVNKYLDNKKDKFLDKDFLKLELNINFILDKIDLIKFNISTINNIVP